MRAQEALGGQNQQTGHITTPIKVLGGDLNIRFDYDGQQFTAIFFCLSRVSNGTLR